MHEETTFMAATDYELITLAQRGDMAAFEQLVFAYDKQVLSIASRYVHSADDAKDIYQEVFLRVYRGLNRFRFKSEFGTWLHRITVNVCLTHRARNKRNRHVSIHDDGRTDYVSVDLESDGVADQHTIDAEINRCVQQAMEELPAKQRLAFMLRHFEGYKLKEIAGIMRCTEGTVKRYLFLATQRMREQLKEVYL